MTAQLGRKFKVYVETSDGFVAEVPVVSLEMSRDCPMDSVVTDTIVMQTVGPVSWMTTSSFKTRTSVRRSAVEWSCDWCGRVNAREHEVCQSCGGARSFVYSC